MALGANLSSGHGCHALNSEETLHGILLSNGAAPPAARKHACMHAPGQTSAFLVTDVPTTAAPGSDVSRALVAPRPAPT